MGLQLQAWKVNCHVWQLGHSVCEATSGLVLHEGQEILKLAICEG